MPPHFGHLEAPFQLGHTVESVDVKSRQTEFFALLALLVGSLLLPGCERNERWNLVLVSFDTTRADALEPYGNPGIHTPAVNDLAAEGVLFELAYAPIPITLPSHASMLTGKVPFAHGVRDNGLFALGEEQTTLAEILRENGYRTGAAIGSFPLLSRFGLDQGFDFYEDHLSAEYEDLHGDRIFPKRRLFFDERKAGRVNEALLPWLEENADEPFFLFVHYFDPHHPHEAPPPFDQLYAHDPYSGEIAYSDESLGSLLSQLKRLGVYDRTLIVFTSDHGEGNGEHNESTHSLLLYNSTLHVPLIIRVPGGTGKRVAQQVSLVDILPTVLDLLGIEIPDDIQGTSLAAWLDADQEPSPIPRAIYAETLSPRFTRNWSELRALYQDGHKYIHGARSELYEVTQDPKELVDLISERPELAAEMKEELQGYLDDHAVSGLDSALHLDKDTLRRLMSLGYLHGGSVVEDLEAEVLREDGAPPQDGIWTISQYSEAKNLLFQERPVDARSLVEDLLESEPENPQYLELLVRVEAQLGRLDKALQVLARMQAQKAMHPPPHELLNQRSRILAAMGRMDQAVESLREAQAIEETALGQYQLARIHGLLQDRDTRLRHLDRALDLDPNLVPARLDRAVQDAQLGNLDQAEAGFKSVIADNPYFPRAFYNYGAFLSRTGQPRKAIAQFERAIALRPDYAKAYYAIIELWANLGERSRAEKSLALLRQVAPDSRETRLAETLVAEQQP